MALDDTAAEAFRLYRWDELPLEKITEMVSRKIVSGTREMVAQHYLKKGALRAIVHGDEVVVREGEILHVPPGVPHQAEAIEDTFTLDLFCPIRQEWLDQPAPPTLAAQPDEPAPPPEKLTES